MGKAGVNRKGQMLCYRIVFNTLVYQIIYTIALVLVSTGLLRVDHSGWIASAGTRSK